MAPRKALHHHPRTAGRADERGRTVRTGRALGAAFSALLAFSGPSFAEEAGPTQLVDMSIEQLINLSVTSAGKKSQKLSEAANAIFVITAEDIRRSGVTSIPEALRMAPGMEVARINSHSWAISSRGFNNLFANKLLVLIDGRSVYTPLFSGVFWDQVDVMLEDIERIEVIRGPGATLWGANAVNGVVNIITKSAAATQGSLASVGGGSEERVLAAIRHGGRSEDGPAYRIYAKYDDRDESELIGDAPSNDDWRAGQIGFRTDGESGSTDSWTLQGDARYQEKGGEFLLPAETGSGSERSRERLYANSANLLGRWIREGGSGESQAQFYIERMERDDAVNEHSRYTFDIELQHRFSPLERHEIVTGAGYRHYEDDIDDTFALSAEPDGRGVDLFTMFLQDEISIRDDVHLILGSKIEHTDFTGFELQPNARLLVEPAEGHSVWAAISRAVRTPSRFANDGKINLNLENEGETTPVSIMGSRSYESENLLAYEAGYRFSPWQRVSIDLALFWNDYDDLQTIEPLGRPDAASHTSSHGRIPFHFDNKADATTRGAELVIDWNPIDEWRLIGSYSYLDIDVDPDESSRDRFANEAEGKSPENQLSLRSLVDLPFALELDSALRYVGALDGSGVPSYYNLDVRLGWRPSEALELSVTGQNLLDSDHLEFVPSDFVVLPAHELQRGVYGKLTWRF